MTVRENKEIFVIKCGGSTLEALPNTFFQELVELKNEGFAPVIVHGGGPAISEKLQRMNVEPRFVEGLRVTDEATLEVVEMVLTGQINKYVVRRIQAAGGKAVGISGMDGGMIQAKKWKQELGYVGEIESVDPNLIFQLSDLGYIPVVSPLGIGDDGQHYNINADTAAGAVAGAIGAKRMIMVTDVPGVIDTTSPDKRLIPRLNKGEIERLIERKVIVGGMIPKVRAALKSLSQNVGEVVIVQGAVEGNITRVMQGEKVGTVIEKGGESHEPLIS